MKRLMIMIFGILMFSGLFAQEHECECDSCPGCTQQDPDIFVGIQAFSIENIGEFGKDWSQGSGIYLTYGVIYSNQWTLVVKTGYIKMQPNDNREFLGDPSFDVVPFTVGTRYYFYTERFRPFLLANGGINYISQDYADVDTTMGESSSKFHFQVGAGLGILIVEGLELEIQAKYNSHLLEPSIPYNINGLEYGVALNWHFY